MQYQNDRFLDAPIVIAYDRKGVVTRQTGFGEKSFNQPQKHRAGCQLKHEQRDRLKLSESGFADDGSAAQQTAEPIMASTAAARLFFQGEAALAGQAMRAFIRETTKSRSRIDASFTR